MSLFPLPPRRPTQGHWYGSCVHSPPFVVPSAERAFHDSPCGRRLRLLLTWSLPNVALPLSGTVPALLAGPDGREGSSMHVQPFPPGLSLNTTAPPWGE